MRFFPPCFCTCLIIRQGPCMYAAYIFVFLSRLLLPVPRTVDRCPSPQCYSEPPMSPISPPTSGDHLSLHSRLPLSPVGRRWTWSCVWSLGHTIRESCSVPSVLHAPRMRLRERGVLISGVKRGEGDLGASVPLYSIVHFGLTLGCA